MSGARQSRYGDFRETLKRPMTWVTAAVVTATAMTTIALHPVERILGWPYDRSHYFSMSDSWPDQIAWLAAAIGLKATWLRVFRRDRTRRETQQIRADLLAGHLKRMPFVARAFGLLFSLALALLSEPSLQFGHRASLEFVVIAWTMFLFFSLQELVFLLVPGENLLPHPNDEPLDFVRSRALKTGFSAAIASLAALSVLATLSPAAVPIAPPICLTATLLIPAILAPEPPARMSRAPRTPTR